MKDSRHAKPDAAGAAPNRRRFKSLWNKVRRGLRKHPKVRRMAKLVGVDDWTIVSRLIEVWDYAATWGRQAPAGAALSRVTERDVTLAGVTVTDLDGDICELPGFAEAMAEVGWLVIEEGGLTFPDWGEWNEPVAEAERKKELAAERKRRQRAREKAAAPPPPPGAGPSRHADVTRDCHARGEENQNKNTPPPTPSPRGDEKAGEGGRQETSEQTAGETLAEIRGDRSPEPPPNRPVRCAADRPDLHGPAQAVVGHYVERVGVPHCGTVKAVVAVMNLLAGGTAESALRRAADHFAAVARSAYPDDARRRMGPARFYGEGEWGRFATAAPIASPSIPKPLPDLTPPPCTPEEAERSRQAVAEWRAGRQAREAARAMARAGVPTTTGAVPPTATAPPPPGPPAA